MRNRNIQTCLELFFPKSFLFTTTYPIKEIKKENLKLQGFLYIYWGIFTFFQ